MGYNILIIDDSSVIRKVLIKTFGMTTIDVSNFFQAENGKVGLDVIRDNWVDIIFLDINMPVMNGMEFMTNLRADSVHSDIPVVIISTEGSKERKDELVQQGIRAYLRKPVSPEDLVETIDTILQGASHEER